MNHPRDIFRQRFNEAFDRNEDELGRELSDFEAEGLEVHVAAGMVEEGLINDIIEVINP